MSLTNNELKSYPSQENCNICKISLTTNVLMMKSIGKLETIAIIQVNTEVLHTTQCKIKYKDCKCYLEYTNVKDGLSAYRCLSCNRDY